MYHFVCRQDHCLLGLTRNSDLLQHLEYLWLVFLLVRDIHLYYVARIAIRWWLDNFIVGREYVGRPSALHCGLSYASLMRSDPAVISTRLLLEWGPWVNLPIEMCSLSVHEGKNVSLSRQTLKAALVALVFRSFSALLVKTHWATDVLIFVPVRFGSSFKRENIFSDLWC